MKDDHDNQKNKAKEETGEKEPDVPEAQKIVNIILKQNPKLFHDHIDNAYACINVEGHKEVYLMKSKRFKSWIIQQYWDITQKPPKSEPIKQAVDLMISLALFKGEEIKLSNRVAETEGTIWYDLCDPLWNVVKITTKGWEIDKSPPILFRRYSHQSKQCTPIQNGDIFKVLDYINISDKNQQLLLLVYLVTSFIPNIPHPIPVLYGSQGSAKSTFLQVLRRLIDPSAIELLTLPNGKDQLVQQLSHHWAPYYDNVTRISEWQSDSLCRAVTGEGFSKRELYSDDEDVIYSFKCCLGLNGINVSAQKADLLDRSILFGLDRITPNERKDLKDFWKQFEKDRPSILGEVFNILSGAIQFKPEIHIEKLPRMADFALWGSAVVRAIGYPQEKFLTAYQENIDKQNEEAINGNPVACAVRKLMENRKEEWNKTPTVLLEELNKIADEEKIDTKQRIWPKAPHVLTRRLNEAKTNLAHIGITIDTEDRSTKERLIKIYN